MTRLYRPTVDECQGALSYDSRLWYRANQVDMVALLNTDEGRDLFRFCSHYPIIAVGSGFITEDLSKDAGRGTKRSTFWTAPKVSNLYRSRLKYTSAALHRMSLLRLMSFPKLVLGGLRGLIPAGSTSSEFFPDPDPETDSVDGETNRTGVDETLSTIIAGAGVGANDDNVALILQIRASTTSNQYNQLFRQYFVFDTASLPDTDEINSATLTLEPSTLDNGLLGEASENSRVEIVESTQASATALVASDYGEVGSTSFGSGSRQDALTAGVDDVITLNASGLANISKTAVSKFAARYRWDLNDTTTGLTWASNDFQRSHCDSAEVTGTGSDPKLTVVHSETISWLAAQPRGSFEPLLIATGMRPY